MTYLWSALTAFSLSIVFVLIALKLFPKIKLMDRPQKYGLTRAPIPYYGGLAIFLSFLITVLIFIPLTPTLIGLLCGAALIVILGFLDDLFSISPLVRLFVQAVAAMILVISGIGILSFNLPLIGKIDLSQIVQTIDLGTFSFKIIVLSAIFTIFWVMAILNTMNFLDGISGLNSGITVIAGLTLFFLSINPAVHENPASQVGVAMTSLILAMSALGFFLFDFPPAKILMGDTGSTFLGFMLATLAIFSGGKIATAFLVLGIPILDMVWTVLRRIFSGQKFWQGDLKHLHHRLLELWASPKKVVLFYLFLTLIFGLSAVSFVNTEQKFFLIIALVVLMLSLIGALVFIPKSKKKI